MVAEVGGIDSSRLTLDWMRDIEWTSRRVGEALGGRRAMLEGADTS